MKTLLAVVVLFGLCGLENEEQTVPKKEQVPNLIKLLKNKDPKLRASAADDLGLIGAIRAQDAEPAVGPLREALRDKEPNVRRAAAGALGKLRLEAKLVVPELAKLLEDKTNAVVIAAAVALGAFGAEAREALPALQKAQKNAGMDKKLRKILQGAIAQVRAGAEPELP